MRCSFLHLADVHLGYQQYGNKERFFDFGRAFLSAAQYAVDHRVRFVLISGDLFHKTSIDALTLIQAVAGLKQLEEARIPAIAIPGNHDASRLSEGASWLEYLAHTGLITLLRFRIDKGTAALVPWDGRHGNYIDIDGVRICGLQFVGASTPVMLPRVAEALRESGSRPEFTVLMAHFGLDGEIATGIGGIQQSDCEVLRDQVDYVALGHWHKPFERDNWIYNPGSLEACSVEECQWHGGYYHVDIDSGRTPRHTARHIPGPRRPFLRLVFEVDLYRRPEDLYAGLRDRLAQEAPTATPGDVRPVVELRLEGVLAFDRMALDLGQIETMLRELMQPLESRVKNNTRATEFEVSPDERLTREQLEHQVLERLLRRDARFQAQAGAWALAAGEIKHMILTGSPHSVIIDRLREVLGDDEEGMA